MDTANEKLDELAESLQALTGEVRSLKKDATDIWRTRIDQLKAETDAYVETVQAARDSYDAQVKAYMENLEAIRQDNLAERRKEKKAHRIYVLLHVWFLFVSLLLVRWLLNQPH